jgi:hypothetical protein
MKNLNLITLLVLGCLFLSNLKANEFKPFGNYQTSSLFYQSELSYQEWFDGLVLCYSEKPYRDDLAIRLISRFPGYNSVYVNTILKLSAGATIVDLISSLTKNSSNSNNKFSEYYNKLSPFFEWYFSLAKKAMDEDQFRRLEMAVGY